METYLEHYVLGGGWSMVLLIPLSVIVVALGGRGRLQLRSATESEETIRKRLETIRSDHGEISAEDVRSETEFEVLRLFSLFQPLIVLAVLAVLIGTLGSAMELSAAAIGMSRSGDTARLAAAIERAFIPLIWGTSIACMAYLFFAALRWRLFRLERDVLRPFAEEIARTGTKGLRR